jgi:hypothetical protein
MVIVGWWLFVFCTMAVIPLFPVCGQCKLVNPKFEKEAIDERRQSQ